MGKDNQSNEKHRQRQSEKDIAINQQLNELKSYLSSKDYKKVQKQLKGKTQKNKQEYLKQQFGVSAKSSKLFMRSKDSSAVKFAVNSYEIGPKGNPASDPEALNIMVDQFVSMLKSLGFIEKAQDDYKGPFNKTLSPSCEEGNRHVGVKAQIKAYNQSSLNQYNHDLHEAFDNGCNKIGKKVKEDDILWGGLIGGLFVLVCLFGSGCCAYKGHCRRSSKVETDPEKRESLLTQEERDVEAGQQDQNQSNATSATSITHDSNTFCYEMSRLSPVAEENGSDSYNPAIGDAHL